VFELSLTLTVTGSTVMNASSVFVSFTAKYAV